MLSNNNEPRHNISYKITLCAQRRLSSVCASMKSDPSLRCPSVDVLDPCLPLMSCADYDQTLRMRRLIGVFTAADAIL